MQLETVIQYRIDGQLFDSVNKAIKHVENRVFKHIQNGTAYAGAGAEQSKMRLELMAYILENKHDIVNLLSADFNIE